MRGMYLTAALSICLASASASVWADDGEKSDHSDQAKADKHSSQKHGKGERKTARHKKHRSHGHHGRHGDHSRRLAGLIARFDKDGDEKLDAAELERFFHTLHAAQAHRRGHHVHRGHGPRPHGSHHVHRGSHGWHHHHHGRYAWHGQSFHAPARPHADHPRLTDGRGHFERERGHHGDHRRSHPRGPGRGPRDGDERSDKKDGDPKHHKHRPGDRQQVGDDAKDDDDDDKKPDDGSDDRPRFRGPGRGPGERGRGPGAFDAQQRERFRQMLLTRFDKDGDGKLNDDERNTAREEMRDRARQFRGHRPPHDKPEGSERDKGRDNDD